MHNYKGSIKNRLLFMMLFIVTVTGSIGYGTFVYWYMANQQERVKNLSETVGLVLSQDFAKLILLNQIDAASDITAKLKSFDRLQSMVLYSAKDETAIYRYVKDGVEFEQKPLSKEQNRATVLRGNKAYVYNKAFYQQMELGIVAYIFEVDTIYDVIKRDTPILLSIGISLLVFAYVLALFLAKKFTLPILNLVSFLEKIDSDKLLYKRIKTKEQNEFGKLFDEVNTMLSRLQQSQKDQKLAAVAFETPSGMTITDANQKILRINSAFTKITGYTQEEIVGQTPKILSSGRHGKSFYEDMRQSLETNRFWSGEIWNRHKNGDVYPEHLTIQAVLNELGQTIYYVAAFLDLTVQKKAQAKIAYLNQYDPLTGLANRQMLSETINAHLNEQKQKGFGAVVCFDINNFKTINETFGHTCGDTLLQKMAKRIKQSFTSCDLQARLGADEFAVWFSFLGYQEDNCAIKMQEFAQELISILSKPFQLKDIVHCIPSIGITLYDNKEKDAAVLLSQADAALHQAKQKLDTGIAFFDPKIQEASKKQLTLYTQLLYALQKEEFILFYQPQYDYKGQIYGAEALIRWEHPTQGVLSPFFFIDVAERTGLILQIGEWVLKSACEQLKQWEQQESTKEWIMAVNVSAKQFNQEGFVTQVKDMLQRYALDPKKLKLELTESLLVEDIESVISKMQQLRALGVQLSLDDFGTGYSSLQYLQKLPLNQVKIDKSFVGDMISNSSDTAIIKSILSLGAVFEFEVIAEGVESDAHYQYLKKLGCNAFQGFYFSKPRPAHKLKQLHDVVML